MIQKLTKTLAAITIAMASINLHAQNLPKGFSIEKVCDLKSPTCYAFAPDGRIFIAEQEGTVKVLKNGALLPAPAFTVDNVKSISEKGVVGMTIDPDFSSNGFLYIFFTKLPSCGTSCKFDLELELRRYKIEGDVATSNIKLLNSGRLSRYWELWNHNGGGMCFGADKKLYVAIGYNENEGAVSNLDSYLGKVLRLNNDGTVPTDNPFYDVNATIQNNSVYAYGFRNPFTMQKQISTGKIFLTEVGSGQGSGREEINYIKAGKDYGYPYNEGYVTDAAYESPVYCYLSRDQTSTTVETINGCAITGGAFLNGVNTQYPDSLKERYFFNDFCNGWISYLDLSKDAAERKPFATGLGKSREGSGNVSLQQGLDGNLYFLSRLSETAKPSGVIASDAKATLNKIIFNSSVGVSKSNKLALHCTIMPNPASGRFVINLINDKPSFLTAEVLDMMGKKALQFSQNLPQGEVEPEFDISTLTAGTYVIQINTHDKFAFKKLVVE